MGPVPLGGGVIIEEHIPGGRLCPQGGSSFALYVPYSLCTYHQAESIRTNRNHSFFIIIHQFLIRIKIRPNHSGNFRFKCFCMYGTIFDSNENQSSIKLPNNFRFEWKSEHWLLRSYNVYNADRCCKESSSKQESVSLQYAVIRKIRQMVIIRKGTASR